MSNNKKGVLVVTIYYNISGVLVVTIYYNISK